VRGSYTSRLFSVLVPRWWNDLPIDVRVTGRLQTTDEDLPLPEALELTPTCCAAPDVPNPSPSHKVRSSDGSWGGARNVERPVGGARSRARHLGGEREAKARRVGGSEDQGEASGGNEDQGKVRGGSEKQERDKWGEQRTRRQGQRVRRDVHNRAEAPNDVHSRATEPSDVHRRAAGPSDVHRRAAAPSDVHHRALAPSDVHRRTTAPWRRCPSRWGLELPKGREGASKVQLVLSSADNRCLGATLFYFTSEKHQGLVGDSLLNLKFAKRWSLREARDGQCSLLHLVLCIFVFIQNVCVLMNADTPSD
ncbi:hypothetical protein QTP70_030118, partial [Hemibagrus guttatus]